MKKIVIILISFVMLFSCKKVDNEEIDLGYGYYPTTEGLYKIFDVTTIHHDDQSGVHDTIKSQLKTVIGERIIDLEGDSVNKFYRYIREFSTEDWILQDVWTIKRDAYRGELVEENQRVIKMVFPSNHGMSWNINAQNSLEADYGTHESAGDSYSLGSFFFDKSVKVRFDLSINLLDQVDVHEVYVDQIGLVQIHNQNFTKVFATPTPKSGDEHHEVMIEYGFE